MDALEPVLDFGNFDLTPPLKGYFVRGQLQALPAATSEANGTVSYNFSPRPWYSQLFVASLLTPFAPRANPLVPPLTYLQNFETLPSTLSLSTLSQQHRLMTMKYMVQDASRKCGTFWTL